MNTLSATRRTLLDIQGFEQVDSEMLVRTQDWLRFAPALCAVIAATGTVLGSPPLLWALATTAAAGAILPFHPFDLVYMLGVRRFSGGPRLPDNRAPRRFACALATVWIIATGAMFAGGYALAGYVLGASMVGVAALVASTHICIPSMIFRIACGQLPSMLQSRA